MDENAKDTEATLTLTERERAEAWHVIAHHINYPSALSRLHSVFKECFRIDNAPSVFRRVDAATGGGDFYAATLNLIYEIVQSLSKRECNRGGWIDTKSVFSLAVNFYEGLTKERCAMAIIGWTELCVMQLDKPRSLVRLVEVPPDTPESLSMH